ncbi:MAG: DUF4405 domain-containing protein [Candidatus Promineifilaceae bacterium]|nr:DUF4405 domain-containing protein [Candidatus Promineifilaceae bacterium]
MEKRVRISRQTRQNWLIDAAVFAGALIATLTGIYFLILPVGGYQGGRNPYYGLTILFGRTTWDDLHTWGGLLMILAVAIHLAWHWSWVKMMGRRIINTSLGRGSRFSRGAKINVLIDALVAVGFFVTAVSGVYFLFLPSGYEGGRNAAWDPGLLFGRTTWDLLHTWGFVLMILAALLHVAIHWRWIVNVSRRFWLSIK